MLIYKVLLYVVIIKTCVTNYSNKWLLKGDLTKDQLREITERFGFRILKKLPTDHYVLTRDDIPKYSKHKSLLHTKRLAADERISFVEQEQWKQVNQRIIASPPQDPKWSHMWYINERKNNSMGILQAWKTNYTGKGVAISIIDDGVDHYHKDLKDRYDGANSRDVYDDDGDPYPGGSRHGTKCAGVALATANNVCVIGVAPEATLIAIRMIGPMGVLPSGQIEGLVNGAAHVSSNSWGGLDNEFDGPSPEIKQALYRGVTSGRSGKGVVYVFAGGNGGFDDNCNTDGYVSSIYTIGINSVTIDHDYPGYAEPCSAILASAYSGNAANDVCSTDINQGCVTDFTGTSASAPMASGVIALVLQANPNLHWRDVQELIVRTSKANRLQYGEFKTNAVGRQVSDWFGYGILDAAELIKTAANWTSLPQKNICDNKFITVNQKISKGAKPRIIESTFATDSCNDTWKCVNSIEHVEVQVVFEYTLRGIVELKLQAPSGTVSTLLTARNGDSARNGKQDWTYMSVQHWGENPVGVWKLNFSMTSNINEAGTFVGWKLTLHGTGEGCTKPKKPGSKSKGKGTKRKDCEICVGIGVPVGVILAVIIIAVIIVALKKYKSNKQVKDIQTANQNNNKENQSNAVAVNYNGSIEDAKV